MRDYCRVPANILLMISLTGHLSPQATIPWHDPSPHTVQFVTVDSNVKLEVLDWGGSGRPLVLLSGLGNTAHIFDDFAPKLTLQYHVYGITRRGFGASSVPVPQNGNYLADRLGDDVIAVLDAFKLEKPVLVGHSIAGEELSSIGSRHPERVAGLIYLDAAYSYAYYDHTRGDPDIDLRTLQRKLEQLKEPLHKSARQVLVNELLRDDLPEIERDLQAEQNSRETTSTLSGTPPVPSGDDLKSFAAYHTWFDRAYVIPIPEAELRMEHDVAADGKVGNDRPAPNRAIIDGEEKFTQIKDPVLAIYAIPHDYSAFYKDAAVQRRAEASEASRNELQVQSFEKGVPAARVIRLSHANHFVFLSNEADVLREMNAFLSSLP
jgi:pimeloyl-ACP methyl ester carboxylesterase